MKKIILILMASILCLCSCQKPDMFIDIEESYFSNFKVEDGKVYIYCSLMIENSSEAKNVTLTALLEDDVKNGLLKEVAAEGYSRNAETKTFFLQKGKNRLEVVFIGEHAGNSRKHDRTLPVIQITVVE